jgi:hypothetical protein
MRSNYSIFFSIIIISTIALGGCKKKLFDYRNKYCGDWEITVNTETHTFGQFGGVTYSTDVYPDASISYNKQTESTITINGVSGLYEVELSTNGSFEGCDISGGFSSEDDFNLTKGDCFYSASGYTIRTYQGKRN